MKCNFRKEKALMKLLNLLNFNVCTKLQGGFLFVCFVFLVVFNYSDYWRRGEGREISELFGEKIIKK